MTMELMGPSLADLFYFCGHKFSLKTTLMIAVQLIQRFKYMHGKHFIHRDVKPDNFLMGLGETTGVVHVVDMGLAKRYYDPANKQHLAYRKDKSLTGTARYASIHAHKGEELSRRDDFEAIGYVLIYFLSGYLPWQNQNSMGKNERYQKIKEIKIQTSTSELCWECPAEFHQYMDYVKNLEFEEAPDYEYMQRLFLTVAKREGICLTDNLYDWNIRAVTLMQHNSFYDFFVNQDAHPFNK